jgi:hypothetical protein
MLLAAPADRTLLAAGLSAGCGPVAVRPASFPDPDVACPGGRVTWAIQIEDQRAKRDAQERMSGSVRDGIQKSFPGCRWGTTDPEAGTIAIEVHRFASHLDAGFWEAAVEWTVTARDVAGHTITEFEVNEEVTRPNYQGSDNEKESLSEAFGKAIERTSKGLSAMSISGNFRHREETAIAADAAPAGTHDAPPTPSQPTASAARAASAAAPAPLERISQPEISEEL